jgi:hypothetical protein
MVSVDMTSIIENPKARTTSSDAVQKLHYYLKWKRQLQITTHLISTESVGGSYKR